MKILGTLPLDIIVWYLYSINTLAFNLISMIPQHIIDALVLLTANMNRMQAIVAIFVFQLVTVHALVESHVVYHSVITGSATPWQKGSRLAEDRVIHIDFALAAPADSLNAAVQALQNISDPNSQNFGQYWTTEAVAQLLAPSQDQIREVARWLNDSGIPRSSLRASSDRGHIYFNTTVHRAEQLLGAQYNDYSDGQVVQVTSDTYYLPLSISKYVDFVLPTLPRSRPHTGLEATTLVQQPGSNRTDTSAVVEVDCFQYMTPECLRLLYNIPDVTNVSSHPNTSFGVYEEAWSTWIPEDLDAFFTDFQPELVGNRPSVLPVDGGFRQTDVQALIFNEEANLDFEYTMSLAYPLPVTNIQVRDRCLPTPK
jgi:tripeptidyl-peptidase I